MLNVAHSLKTGPRALSDLGSTLVPQRVVQRIVSVAIEIISEFHVSTHIGREAGILFAKSADQRIAALSMDLAVKIAVPPV